MLHQELTKKIIGCAFTVHNTLGAGFLEKILLDGFSGIADFQWEGIFQA